MKPQVVQGTRDFSPQEVMRRNYIFDTLKHLFLIYGYQPLETPAMENLDTLTGKYGEEGDQLLFKILNNGDFLTQLKPEKLDSYQNLEVDKSDRKKVLQKERIAQQIAFDLCKRGLRFDLTVPFARYVVMNRNEISLPFKRQQIQAVWRGDSPQKGRYREFYQCDIDVVGSDSLLYEAELMQIYDQAFYQLNLGVKIRINHRKLLEGIAEAVQKKELFVPMTISLDKLDKIGWNGVGNELSQLGFSTEDIDFLQNLLSTKNWEQIKLKFSKENSSAQKGLKEIDEVLAYLKSYRFQNRFEVDLTLARGLSYYTGCIFEVEVDTQLEGQSEVKMGSIGGGGRYDNLTGIFGWEGISGVGISFGADRIYDVLLQLDKFQKAEKAVGDVILLPMDKDCISYAFELAHFFRKAEIKTEVYPEASKFQKQMKYADKLGFPFAIIIGTEEIQSGLLTLKDMASGTQYKMSKEDILKKLGLN